MVREKLKGIDFDEMKPEDVPEVVAIENASFNLPWSEASFFNQIHNPRSVSRVARIDKRIIGYICASRIIDEGHILDLAMHPEFRKCGIASALIKHIIEHLRENDCRFIFLEVRASNETAKKMYERFNFEVIGIRKNYYVLPVEDAVVMVLKIKD